MNRHGTRCLSTVRVVRTRRPNVTLSFLMPFLLGGVWGCEHQPEGWTPVQASTSEVDRMSERVGVALEHLTSDPDQAEAALQETAASLEHLRGYYLPLFQARERAYNAYRSLYLDDRDRVMLELERIGRQDGCGGGTRGRRPGPGDAGPCPQPGCPQGGHDPRAVKR